LSLSRIRDSWFRTESADCRDRADRKFSDAQFGSDPWCLKAWYALRREQWSPSWCANCALASSASRWRCLGLWKTLGTDMAATTESASFEHR